MPRINLQGQVFGKLTVDEYAGQIKRRNYWYCTCECGTETLNDTTSLKSGHSQSCGCQRKKTLSEIRKTHGYAKTAEYRAWSITRADGAKWSFEEFIKALGDKPSESHRLSKKDCRKPHGPNNTYWKNLNEEKRKQADLDHRTACSFDLRSHLRAIAAERKGETAA